MFIFESKHQRLAPFHIFFQRLSWNFIVGMLIMALSLGIGMAGYHYFEGMSWIEAFANASMILSGMGPMSTLKTEVGQVFAGIYALFSGVLFLVAIAIIFAPIFHRVAHQFHLKE